MNGDNKPNFRILVADDSPTVLNILQAMLEDQGYDVIPAMDGIEAISKAYKEHPDLIVLDIFMPKINGYQVCRLLKNDEITSHIPVVMLTGSEKGDKFWSLQTGADEFKTKDFEFHSLTETIERLLKRTLDVRAVRHLKEEANAPASARPRSIEKDELDNEIQIMSKLSHLLDRELYNSTLEKIRLETILDNLGEGVFTVDADKRIVAFNKSLRQMTELSLDQVVGKKCSDVIKIPLCDDSCLFDKALENANRESGAADAGAQASANASGASTYATSASFLSPVTMETELEGPHGKKIPVSLYMALLKDHVGKIVGAVCVCRDITRMKEIEIMNEELSKAYSDLKDAQAQLIQSEKMASLGRLVAGAAHELNNPISFIYSNISHLRNYIRDMKMVLSKYHDIYTSSEPQIMSSISEIEEFRKQIDLDYTIRDLDRLVSDIDEGAKRTKEIVEDLKAFSRSDEGRIESLSSTDINEDIEKSLSLLVDYYKGRINIHKDYGDLPRVKCYAGQLSQVFMNLITNACQAIDGDGDIWITTKLEDDMAVISVRDNGPGIAEEHIDKIFDPFFTTKEVGKGAGLGLSISYGIVQRHKGKILVDSQVGSGTNFTVRIPVDFESR